MNEIMAGYRPRLECPRCKKTYELYVHRVSMQQVGCCAFCAGRFNCPSMASQWQPVVRA